MGRISMPQGKGSQMHNRREYEKYGLVIPSNIDPTKMHLNVTLVDKDIQEAYEEIFGESLRRYNKKQSREDRKIKNYYEKIKKSKNGEKLFYEDVLQWGKMEDFEEHPELREKAKEALILYAETFESRNPNLKVIGAYIHMDEASPHLHLDYIPVAHGYSRGMDTRNSLDKAMKEMGYHPEKESKLNNATKLWKENERAFFGEICRRKGLDVEAEREARGSLSVEEYKEAKERMLTPIREEKEKELEKLKFYMDTSRKLTDPKRKEDVGLRNPRNGEKKTYTPLPELKRRYDRLIGEIEQKTQEASSLDSDIYKKGREAKHLDVAVQMKELNIQTLSDKINNKRSELTNLEDEAKQKSDKLKELDDQIDSKSSEMERLADEVIQKHLEVSTFDNKLKKAEQKFKELQGREQSLSSQIDRKRSELADAERLAGKVTKKRQEELNQIDARITELKEQRQSLRSQIDNMRSELAKSERLASEVTKKRKAVEELDQQIEERQEELMSMAAIDEHEMHSILNDAITKNLVSRIVKSVCKLLSEWGVIKTDPSMLAVKLTRPILTDLGKSMDGFLQDVKEHMLKSLKKSAQKKRKTR